jgi:hypothetical protein
MFFLLSLMFLFNKIGEEEGRTGSAWKQKGWSGKGRGAGERSGPNDVYTYDK